MLEQLSTAAVPVLNHQHFRGNFGLSHEGIPNILLLPVKLTPKSIASNRGTARIEAGSSSEGAVGLDSSRPGVLFGAA